MNQRASLWTGVSMLIVAVVAILAFSRDWMQFWLLLTTFIVWGLWAGIKFLIPFLRKVWYRHQIRSERKNASKQVEQVSTAPEPVRELPAPIEAVLIRHVNHRVTAYLKSVYPEAAWQWCEEFPERIAANGGTGRIKLFNIPDFDYADISLNQMGHINCSLLKVVSLAEAPDTAGKPVMDSIQPTVIDPQVWYDRQGREILNQLIMDLDSRGYNSLEIQENGDITIRQGEECRTVKKLENMPEKTYWPRLIKVFESAGLAAAANEAGIVLTW